MFHKKVDRNHSEIVEAFRTHPNVSVFSTAALGDGVPDLIVGLDGITFLVEIKDGTKPPSKKKLNPLQQSWHKNWNGSEVRIVTSVSEAHQFVENIRKARRVFSNPIHWAEDTST